MADAAKESPEGDKLPRAHKRCINKDCREVLTLATKVRARGWAWAAAPPPPPVCRSKGFPGRWAPAAAWLLKKPAPVLPIGPQYCKKCNTQQFERRGSQKRSKGEDSGVRPRCCRRPDWRVLA